MQIHARYLPTLLGVVCLSVFADAQASGQETTSEASAKQTALDWLTGFEKDQALFNAEDIQELRERLTDGTEEEAQQWLKSTQETREALDSPEWKSTQAWFKQFLEVQAFYTDEQIEQFKQEVKEAAKNDPVKLKELLGEIENKRQQMARNARTSAALRQSQLDLVNAYRRDQISQRSAAARAARVSQTNPAAVAPPPVPRTYNRPTPLVTSLDVARWEVMRSFWGPWTN